MNSFTKKKLFLLTNCIFFILASCSVANGQSETQDISSFEQCASAGNPVQKTFPGRCVTKDGKIFEATLPEVSDFGVGNSGQSQANCKNLCGNGICEEIVCMAIGCPCVESPETCPKDCKSQSRH